MSKLVDMAGIVTNRFEDSRGEILWLDFHGVKANLVFSKAGTYRSGDVHPNRQFDLLLSGRAKVKRHLKDHDCTEIYHRFHLFSIGPDLPHLFEFLEDTVMLEWWDGPFSAEYYEPYRKIVEESMK